MIVYLGSTNPVKIASCEEVLNPLGYEVIGLNVNSGVNKQPLSDEETIKGAINRALQLPTNGLRFGLEAGVEWHNKQLFLVNWGVLIDEANNYYYAGGTRIPLPEDFNDYILIKNLELSDIMDLFYQKENIKHQEGAIGFFTNNLVKRIDIFTHIVKLLIGQYFKKMEENK